MSDAIKLEKEEIKKPEKPLREKVIPEKEVEEKLTQESEGVVSFSPVETGVPLKVNKIEVIVENADELYQGLLLLNQILWDRMEKGNPPNMNHVREIAIKIVDSYSILPEILAVMTSTHILTGKYLPIHTLNVALLSIYFGIALDYERSELIDLGITGVLHDIGMLNLPREILLKNGKLHPEEILQIREHPRRGSEIIKDLKDVNARIIEGIYYHHERENGSGYHKKVDGLISEFARIIALADTYEALTHPRRYKKAIPPAEAMKQIISTGKEAFSENLLRLMSTHFFFYPPGSLVQLNNGEVGRVKKVHPNFPTQPMVEIILDKEGRMWREPRVVDLMRVKELSIEKSLTETNLLELIDERSGEVEKIK